MKNAVNYFMILVMTMLGLFSGNAAKSKTEEYSAKVTPVLKQKLDESEDEDEIQAYIELFDVEPDVIIEEFEHAYPMECDAYIAAKEYGAETDVELLQRAIEIKRSIYASKYHEQNQAFADSAATPNKQIWVSEYSPLIIVQLKKTEILRLLGDDRIVGMDLFVNSKIIDALARSNNLSGAAYVRDTYGNKGAGVKIGQIERGIPMSDSDLDDATITIWPYQTSPQTSHATRVARILVGESQGIVPQAELYSAGVDSVYDFFRSAEWMITEGVNIINMSFGEDNPQGTYTSVSAWIDHIAIQHDVHCVVGSGNSGGMISQFGMAYNAITVGGFDDKNNDTTTDDTLYSMTAYEEADTAARPEKPNLVASAVNIYLQGMGNDSGTSFATPQVAGVIAQLCSYKTVLKTRQSTVGAMLAAGTKNRVNDPSDYAVPGSKCIFEKEGTGKLGARSTRWIAASNNCWRQKIQGSDFPYTKTILLNAGDKTRVAIFWLKKNQIAGSGQGSHYVAVLNQTPFSNLDLKVYDPSGIEMKSSTKKANFEVVEFTPSVTGTYTIMVSRAASATADEEIVGIAVR